MQPARLLAIWLRSLADRVDAGAQPGLIIRWPLVSGRVGEDRVGFSVEDVYPYGGRTWEDILKEQLRKLSNG